MGEAVLGDWLSFISICNNLTVWVLWACIIVHFWTMCSLISFISSLFHCLSHLKYFEMNNRYQILTSIIENSPLPNFECMEVPICHLTTNSSFSCNAWYLLLYGSVSLFLKFWKTNGSRKITSHFCLRRKKIQTWMM